jgi:hypothetical protein
MKPQSQTYILIRYTTQLHNLYKLAMADAAGRRPARAPQASRRRPYLICEGLAHSHLAPSPSERHDQPDAVRMVSPLTRPSVRHLRASPLLVTEQSAAFEAHEDGTNPRAVP